MTDQHWPLIYIHIVTYWRVLNSIFRMCIGKETDFILNAVDLAFNLKHLSYANCCERG